MCHQNDLERLCELLRLLPFVFTNTDRSLVGRPISMERDARRLQKVAEYVQLNFVHAISLDEVSAHVGMNRSAFCAFFKRLKGKTFSQFLTQYRLETACELLRTSSMNVSEISFMVGFNDVPHFNRMFKEQYGMSPSQFRSENKEK